MNYKKILIIQFFVVLILIGCIPQQKRQLPPPQLETLNLIVGQTRVSEVTRVLQGAQIVSVGGMQMLNMRLYGQNTILKINITQNGDTFSRILDLRTLPGYMFASIKLTFRNGVLFYYDIN